MLILLCKCRQAKIIPYFQSQFCVILISLHLILKPKVAVTVLVTMHYSIRQYLIAGKQACCYSKSHLVSRSLSLYASATTVAPHNLGYT